MLCGFDMQQCAMHSATIQKTTFFELGVYIHLLLAECEVRNLPIRPEQTRLRRCLLYGFVYYSGKGTKSFDVLTGDQELEVCTVTYGPEIDQSQHAKSVSHVINHYICTCYCKTYNACIFNTQQNQ